MSSAAEDFRAVGPLGQAVALAFRFLFWAVCVIAAGWFVSNFRQIPADSQAVVMRLGTVARVQGSGLLIAWPRPIEDVVVLPASARQIGLDVAQFEQSPSSESGSAGQGFDLARDMRLNGGFLLTGDSNVVHLQARIFYHVSDPVAYMSAQDHVRPALSRLLISGAIAVIGRRDLDSILVARPEIAARPLQASAREALREDMLRAVNARLARLAENGASLGVMVNRVDLVPTIPASAKSAFDNVLVVSQSADTAIAQARTAAQVTAEDAASKKDKIATEAGADSEETLTNAKSQTASIIALAEQTRDTSHDMQMSRIYYDRIASVLKKAGSVEAVDPSGATRLLLPGVNRESQRSGQ